MKPVTLYKGNSSYLCETEARLEKFKAAGWSEDKSGKKAKKSEKDNHDETSENEN